MHIDVRDNGPGIPPEHLEQVFEPLFSTKTLGVGLGLSLVRQIMHLHGGSVTIENIEQGGTSVRLSLPAA